jgi:hypothetical protein
MASGDITAKSYQCTRKHQAEVVVDGDYASGSSTRHIELDGTSKVVVAFETPTGVAVRLGTKDGLGCVPFTTTDDASITGTYTLEDFIKLSSTAGLLVMRKNTGNIWTAVVTYTAPNTLAIASATDSSCDAVTASIKGCLLDTNKCVIVYKDTSDSYPKSVICSISSTTPSYGTPVNMKAAACTNATALSVCKVTTGTFFATYDNGTNFYGHELSVSGTTITTNTESLYAASLNTFAQCCLMDSTHVAVTFSDAASSSYGSAVIAVISGTTISSWGSKVAYTSYAISPTSIVMLTDTKFIITCIRSILNTVYSIIGIISSGTTITYGTIVTPGYITSTVNLKFTVCYIDTTHISYVVYETDAAIRRIYYQVATITGNSITFNYMTTCLCKASDVNISVALFSLVNTTTNIPSYIYINGNENTNKFLQINMYNSSAVTDTEFGRGILKLPNSPISVNDGYGIYVATTCASSGFISVLSASGQEEEV